MLFFHSLSVVSDPKNDSDPTVSGSDRIRIGPDPTDPDLPRWLEQRKISNDVGLSYGTCYCHKMSTVQDRVADSFHF